MCALILILAGALPGQTAAPEGPSFSVRFLVEKGQVGYCRNEGWAILEVTLSNPTEEDRTGTLVVEVPPLPSGPGVLRRYTSAVRLPVRSKRKIRLPIDTGVLRSDRINFFGIEDRTTFVRARLVLSDGPALPWKNRNLMVVIDEERLVAVVSGTGKVGGFSYLGGRPVSWGKKDDKTPQTFLVYLDAGHLPDDPLALRRLDAVVLSRLSPWHLTVAQQEALIAYVSLGGNLIVSSAQKGVPHRPTTLDRILPGIPTSYRELAALERLPLLFSDGAPGEEPMPIQDLQVGSGASFVLWEGDHPIWAERRVGSGRVAAIAFDLSAESIPDWECKDVFVQWLLYGPESLPVLPPVPGPEEPNHGITPRKWVRPSSTLERLPRLAPMRQVMAATGAPIPSIWWIGGLIFAYLSLMVPVNYLFWRRRGRLEGAWAVAVLLALLSTGGILTWRATAGRLPLHTWELEVSGGILGSPARVHRHEFGLRSGERGRIDLDLLPGTRIHPPGKGATLRGVTGKVPELSLAGNPGIRGLRVERRSELLLEGAGITLQEESLLDRLQMDEDGGWQGEVDLGWKGPPDGAILLTLDGWARLETGRGRGAILPIDIQPIDLREYVGVLWRSRMQDEDTSAEKVGIWVADLPLDDPWTPAIVGLLDTGAAEVRYGGRPFAQLVAWKQTGDTNLVPLGGLTEAETLRVLMLDVPHPRPAGSDSWMRWIGRLGSHLPDGGGDVVFIPCRSLAGMEVSDLRLRLLRDPSSLSATATPWRGDGVIRSYRATAGWETVGGLPRVFPWEPDGFPLSPDSHLEAGTGVALFRLLRRRWVPPIVRDLELIATVSPKEEP